ncbi:MAG: PhnD/SsuA/transferrin family substrate-binding protein [Burkholderiales bacterium]|nr:PhnD/SsuA/transferrin family substrate-binding protein [Phycisphaerae bacterium]
MPDQVTDQSADQSQNQSRDTRPPRRPHRLLIVTLLAGLAVCAVFLVNYMGVTAERDQSVEMQNKIIAELTGVNKPPAANKLADRFADANGDLIADAPADLAKQMDPPVLKFSYIPSDDQDKFRAAFKELMEAISVATGKPVEYVEYPSADDELIAMSRGDLTIAGFNTGSVPIAVCATGFVPLVMMADAQGRADYKMEVLTAAKSPVKQLTDVKSREFTFTEPTSNSGYKAALVALRDVGLIPGKEFQARYSQGHRQSLEGLRSGTYETISIANDVLKRAEVGGDLTQSDYRSIYTSDKSFPTAAIGCRHDLKPELLNKIRETMIKFNWTGTGMEKTFGREGRSKFITADYAKDWEYVRQIDNSIGYEYKLPAGDPATMPAINPSTMPAPDPAAEPEVAEPDARRER